LHTAGHAKASERVEPSGTLATPAIQAALGRNSDEYSTILACTSLRQGWAVMEKIVCQV
jgi:hypothetical protein